MHRLNYQKIKGNILDIIFPKYCINCKKEGEYLCQDCEALVELLEYRFCLCEKPTRLVGDERCRKCSRTHQLKGLYFATPYQNNLAKTLLHLFKYEPFARDLSRTIASIIINHFQLLGKKKEEFADFILLPVPLAKRRLRWRGFNQSEEIGKWLADFLNIPIVNDALIKTRNTIPQIQLSGQERKENIKGAFFVLNKEIIIGKKVLLIDDVYTTGATMEECVKTLKESGAKEIWGVVAARG